VTMCPAPGTSVSDGDLAARFVHEAGPFFDVLSRRARRLTRCDADSEDLLQDTLLHAYAGFRTFQEGTNVQAWLFRILHNRWVSRYRSRLCRPVEVSVDEVTERDLAWSAAHAAARQCSAEAEVLDALPNSEIRAALATLPEGFRAALYFSDVQGYTYAETAAILNIPHGTVMSRVSRGRRRLRIALTHVARSRGDFAAVEQRTA
jgi:RNA polymerase sigma factor (sigma-70 family)